MDDNLIWSAYDRNCLYYSKCKELKTCTNIIYDCCYCHNNALLQPNVIANCGFSPGIEKPNINKKCYIKFGEICSICIEPIITKKSAWLTPCGHTFHRKCLIDNFQYRTIHKMTIGHSNEIPCPVCREGLIWCCVGIDKLDKYNSKNGLDQLENFWHTIDINPYLLCWECDNAVGMKKSCNNCIQYRNTGKFY